MIDEALRLHLARLLDWGDAHPTFEAAVADLPRALQGTQPPGLPYSPWQLLEHLRITQRDLLEFCRNPAYEEPTWPDDYWPDSAAPPSAAAWERSVQAYRTDREVLRRMAEDPEVDLLATIPHGAGQTYLRELLLAGDHGSYHLGQLIAVRRLLGAWPPGNEPPGFSAPGPGGSR
jgi:hypothetical protein